MWKKPAPISVAFWLACAAGGYQATAQIVKNDDVAACHSREAFEGVGVATEPAESEFLFRCYPDPEFGPTVISLLP